MNKFVAESFLIRSFIKSEFRVEFDHPKIVAQCKKRPGCGRTLHAKALGTKGLKSCVNNEFALLNSAVKFRFNMFVYPGNYRTSI